MLAPQQGIMCSRAVIPRCGATLTRHGVQPAIDDEDARRIASGLFVSNFPDSTYNGALLPSTRQHNHHGSQRSTAVAAFATTADFFLHILIRGVEVSSLVTSPVLLLRWFCCCAHRSV